jgi:hypothetical protein
MDAPLTEAQRISRCVQGLRTLGIETMLTPVGVSPLVVMTPEVKLDRATEAGVRKTLEIFRRSF